MLSQFTFKVADPAEVRLALQLRRIVYQEDFNHAPDEALDEAAYQLVARNRDGEILGALRVIGPEQRPFDLERCLDLSPLLSAERSVALVGGLCVRRDYRLISDKGFLAMGMLKLAYLFARRHELTDFLIYVYPYLRRFYRGAFFEVLVPAFEHPVWGNMCVMRLDIPNLEQRHRHSTQPFARFLFNGNDTNYLV